MKSKKKKKPGHKSKGLKKKLNKGKTTPVPKKPESKKEPKSFQKHELILEFRLFLMIINQHLKVIFRYAAFVLIAAIILTVIDIQMDQRILANVTVGPVKVGIKTQEQAITEVQATLQNYLTQSLEFHNQGQIQKITPSELGITFYSENSLQNLPIMQFKHPNILYLVKAIFKNKVLPLTFEADSEKILSLLEKRFNVQKPSNAKLVFNGKNLEVEKENSGFVINREKLLLALNENLENLSNTPIEIVIEAKMPTVIFDELQSQKEHFKNLLNSPIAIVFQKEKWKINLYDHLSALEFEKQQNLDLAQNQSADSNKILMILNKIKIDPFLQQEIISKIQKPPLHVKISKNDQSQIIIEGKAENGIKVEKDKLLTGLNLAINNKIPTVDLVIKEEKPLIDISSDLQQLGVKDLIATGHTAFAGSSQDRIHNINVGIAKYNGLLIKPGGTFSFNEYLGPVDKEQGFKPELVIKSDGTVPEYGGGLCQVSSTLYRAALYGGFPIVERSPHSYAVSYYAQIAGYGLDATIYPGVKDIKFLNDSPGHILIQAYTDGINAYFKFYGTPDNRTVRMEGPYEENYRGPGAPIVVNTDTLKTGQEKIVEKAHTGFDVRWYRYIEKNGQELKEEIFSRYKAIPAKVLVGQ